MSEPHETYARMQSLRIRNLEQQVQVIQGELQRLREGMLQQNEVEKFINLKKRLKELNATIIELRMYYNDMEQAIQNSRINVADPATKPIAKDYAEHNKHQIEQLATYSSNLGINYTSKCFGRENAGFDRAKSIEEPMQKESGIDVTIGKEHRATAKEGDPFKTCKQLMDEIKPPGSILGNYLTRLQDFQVDPELRRQRWERKQQQKLQQLQKEHHIKPRMEDKATITDETCININAESSYDLAWPITFPNNIQLTNRSSDNSSSATDSNASFQMPIIRKDLKATVEKLAKDGDDRSIALALFLENDVYHLSISHITDGQQLACFLVTEEAVQEAKKQHLFQDFLTFFVMNAENSKSQKRRVLGHLFELIKIDTDNTEHESE